MLNAYNADLANVNKALGVIKTAPANVQAAFKNLLSFETTFRNDIQNASSEQASSRPSPPWARTRSS